jgi:hypothetical protein
MHALLRLLLVLRQKLRVCNKKCMSRAWPFLIT